MSKLSSLKKIYLGSNEYTDSGLIQFSKRLKKIPNITLLHLYGIEYD